MVVAKASLPQNDSSAFTSEQCAHIVAGLCNVKAQSRKILLFSNRRLVPSVSLIGASVQMLRFRWVTHLPAQRHIHSGASGLIIVRHMCVTGVLSLPSPSMGCRKWRPIMSVNSSIETWTLGSKE